MSVKMYEGGLTTDLPNDKQKIELRRTKAEPEKSFIERMQNIVTTVEHHCPNRLITHFYDTDMAEFIVHTKR